MTIGGNERKPGLLVLASTYPRWKDDHEPGFVHELSKRLVGHFEVVVLCPHAPGAASREVVDGVSIVRYRYAPARFETLVHGGGMVANLKRMKWKALLLPSFALGQAWGAWRLLRERDIDVVHAHWLVPQGMVAALLQGLAGGKPPLVVTSHGADLYALRSRPWVAVKRHVARMAAAITVVSSAMSGELAALGADLRKVVVLSMGVDVAKRFTPDPSIPRSADELLFVGRLVEKKGVEYLLRAMPAILRERPITRLTVAGFGPDEARLRALVEELGIGNAVGFLGAVAQVELPALYRRAAVFVAPFVRAKSGDQEGLPVALMEAIACGCPVIAGDVAGLHDMLGAHANEVALDPRDVAELTARVLGVLADPVSAGNRAVRMSADVRTRFDWDKIALDYKGVLLAAMK